MACFQVGDLRSAGSIKTHFDHRANGLSKYFMYV